MKEKIEDIINETLKRHEFELPKDEYSAVADELAQEIVKLFAIPDVSLSVCEHPTDMRVNYHDWTVLCTKCRCIISQFGKEINPPHKL